MKVLNRLNRSLKSVALLLLMGLSFHSFAQKEELAELDNMRIDHVLMVVHNFEETVQWYEEVLGFRKQVQWEVEGLDNLDLAYLIKGGFRIELIGDNTAEKSNPSADSFGGHLAQQGFAHLCFFVEDVDKASDEIKAQGIEMFAEPKTYALNQYWRRVSFFKDLNGNMIELAGPMVLRDKWAQVSPTNNK